MNIKVGGKFVYNRRGYVIDRVTAKQFHSGEKSFWIATRRCVGESGDVHFGTDEIAAADANAAEVKARRAGNARRRKMVTSDPHWRAADRLMGIVGHHDADTMMAAFDVATLLQAISILRPAELRQGENDEA